MKAFVITSADIGRCPKRSFSARHYREDGTCRCDEQEAAKEAVLQARENIKAAKAALTVAHQAERAARDWWEST